MRNAVMVAAALSAVVAGSLGGATPAAAYDDPYCLQGKGVGFPGECAYRSYAECMDSASGRALVCSINPRVAYGQQLQRARPYSGRPHKRHRDY